MSQIVPQIDCEFSFAVAANNTTATAHFHNLRVNVSKDQSRCFQRSSDLADFHIYCSVFHADSRGAIRFS